MSKPISRNEFLQRLGRGGFMFGMAGVSAAALHGTKDPSECFNDNYCQQCWGFHTCELPEKKDVNDERA